jgi:hypothetical protein
MTNLNTKGLEFIHEEDEGSITGGVSFHHAYALAAADALAEGPVGAKATALTSSYAIDRANKHFAGASSLSESIGTNG